MPSNVYLWSSVAVYSNTSATPIAYYFPSDFPSYPNIGTSLDSAVRARVAADGISSQLVRLEYIPQVPTSNAGPVITGDLSVTGTMTATQYEGDGSHLLNLPGRTQWSNIPGGIQYSGAVTVAGSAQITGDLSVGGTLTYVNTTQENTTSFAISTSGVPGLTIDQDGASAVAIFRQYGSNVVSIADGGALQVAGNVTAANFVGNGVGLTGLRTVVAVEAANGTVSLQLGDGTYANADVSSWSNLANGTYTGVIQSGDVVVGGSLAVGNTVTATRLLTGAVLASGNLAGSNAAISNNLQAANIMTDKLTVTGAISTGTVFSAVGNATAANLVANLGVVAQTLTISGLATAGNLVTSGNITVSNVTASNSVVTKLLIGDSATLTGNLAASGDVSATVNVTTGNLAVTTNTITGNLVATTNVTAGTFVASTNIISAGLSVSGVSYLNAANATGTITAYQFIGNGTTQWTNVGNGVSYSANATISGLMTADGGFAGDGSRISNLAAISGLAIAANGNAITFTYNNAVTGNILIPSQAPAVPNASAVYFDYLGPDGGNIMSGIRVAVGGQAANTVTVEGIRALDLTSDGRVANIYAVGNSDGIPALSVSRTSRPPLVANVEMQGTTLVVKKTDGNYSNTSGVWQSTADGIEYTSGNVYITGDLTVSGTTNYVTTYSASDLIINQANPAFPIADFQFEGTSVANINATGNIQAPYFIGNGAYLTGTNPSQWNNIDGGISYGSNVTVGNLVIGNSVITANNNQVSYVSESTSANHVVYTGQTEAMRIANGVVDISGTLRTRGIRDLSKAVPFGDPIYFWEGLTAFTVADEPLKRMTLVGGATFDATYYSTKWNNLNMIGMATCSIQTATTVPHVVPTAYVRLMIPVDITQHCMFFMQCIADDRWSSSEVWVCNAALTPVVRLQARSNVNSTNTNNSTNSFLGPRNSTGKNRGWYEWVGFSVPLSIIQGYYQLDGTTPVLNLALSRSINGGTPTYISGLAMVPNPRGISFVGATDLNWKVNTGDAVTWNSIWNQEAMVQVNGSATANTFVPIMSVTDDIYLTIICHNDTNYMNTNIWHNISGVYYQFNPYQIGLAAEVVRARNLYRFPYGRIITANVINAMKVTISGRDYLPITLTNLDNRQPCYFRGIIIENV